MTGRAPARRWPIWRPHVPIRETAGSQGSFPAPSVWEPPVVRQRHAARAVATLGGGVLP